MADEQEIKAAIKRITDERWAVRKAPILLSELPSRLEAEIPDYRDVLGSKSLKAFASDISEASGVKLVEHPSQRAKLGLVPTDVVFEFSTEEITQQGISEGSRLRGPQSQEPVLFFLRALRALPPDELEKVVIPVSTLVKLLK